MLSIVFLVFWELLGPWSSVSPAWSPSDKGHSGVMAQLRGMGTGNAPPHSPSARHSILQFTEDWTGSCCNFENQ